ncbi:MAG: hypothetical protein AB8B85_03230 [Paracoccaceae bacterium]
MSDIPPYVRVKVFGERASGTNFLARLLYANFKVEPLLHADPNTHSDVQPVRAISLGEKARGAIGERIEDYLHETTMATTGGWKHACLTDKLFRTLENSPEVLFICISRHPALWIRSFFRNPFSGFCEDAPDIETMLRTPWVSRPRDELAELVLPGPAILWRRKHESYLRYAHAKRNVKLLRHEDVLRDPNTVLDLLAPLMTRRRDAWGLPKGYGRTWQDGQDLQERDFFQIRDELPEDPWAEISSDAAEILRSQIGAPLLEKLGYD